MKLENKQKIMNDSSCLDGKNMHEEGEGIRKILSPRQHIVTNGETLDSRTALLCLLHIFAEYYGYQKTKMLNGMHVRRVLSLSACYVPAT